MQLNSGQLRILVASPSLDAYGSDRQMLESVVAFREAGCVVVVIAPAEGRLQVDLEKTGAEVRIIDFPVLTRSTASVRGLTTLFVSTVLIVPRLVKVIQSTRADIVYVNTVTLPWWLLAGRLARVRTVCHVHEAEARDPLRVRRALALPLLLAHKIIVNSRATQQATTDIIANLKKRTRRIYNGVQQPASRPKPIARPLRHMVVVGRLSPRKSPQTAIDAVALLRGRGRDVTLELCGAPVEGMEPFSEELSARVRAHKLRDVVRFSGYCSPIWPLLEDADVLLAPSLGESFGNAVVEGQLACRPVIATALQGHLETVVDGETGLLVPANDPRALADAVERLLEDPSLARRLAQQGQESAERHFSSTTYRAQIRKEVLRQ